MAERRLESEECALSHHRMAHLIIPISQMRKLGLKTLSKPPSHKAGKKGGAELLIWFCLQRGVPRPLGSLPVAGTVMPHSVHVGVIMSC